MKRLRYLIPTIFMIFSMSIITQAQRGGRGGDGDGVGDGDRTPIAPVAQFTPSFSGTITPPEDFPSRDEIETMIQDFDLPLALEGLDFATSSPEAYTAIVTFGQSYLGINVNPFYAGTIPDMTNLPTTDIAVEIPDEIASMSSELPSELQSMLGEISGVPYWGVYENGAAALYLDADCSQNCSVDIDSLALTLSNGSLGFYTVYRPGQISDPTNAQNMIFSTYPALMHYSLTPYEVEAGFAFLGTNITTSSEFTGTAFLAGATSVENGQSIIYVIFGIGEGYVEVIR